MINRACISLSENCNFKCKYCHFNNRGSKKSHEFSDADLMGIIDNIHSYSIRMDLDIFTIGIVGAGEPLLNYTQLVRLVDYAANNEYSRLRFYTITNGSLLTMEHFQFFLKYKDYISLNFSLDGDENLHNFGRMQFQTVFSNILKYETLFGQKPHINCTVHRKTIERADSVLSFFHDEGFKDVTFSILKDDCDSGLSISRTEFDRFLSRSKDFNLTLRQLKPENINKYDCTMYGRLCGVGLTNIFITKQGIYPCGRFYGNQQYSLGKFTDSLVDVESTMSFLKPINPGECYYDKYLGGVE